MGCFRPIFEGSRIELIYFGKTGKILDRVHPDFALIKLPEVTDFIVLI